MLLRDLLSDRYGFCRVCSLPIVYPGLDHNLCFECGWVRNEQWHQSRLAQLSKKVKDNGRKR